MSIRYKKKDIKAKQKASMWEQLRFLFSHCSIGLYQAMHWVFDQTDSSKKFQSARNDIGKYEIIRRYQRKLKNQ